MSITFYAVNGNEPRVMEFGLVYKQVEVPELNLSNDNAAALLGLLGLPLEDGYGEVSLEEAEAAVAVTDLFFEEVAVEHTREPERGKNFYTFGIDKRYLFQRIEQLKNLLHAAKRGGATTIYWA
jgi:hypothetical protein